MARYKSFFSWRTAPRSIQILIDWLPYFNEFKGESWTQKTNGKFKLRRKLRWTYEANSDNPDKDVVSYSFEDFVKGKQHGSADKESLVRQVSTTAEQFGFLGTRGTNNLLYVTEAGLRIIDKTFTPEDFLVQLLKMYVITNKTEEGIFPFEIFIHLLDEFKSLSRYELTYMFAVTTPSKYENAVNAIKEFRSIYNDPRKINNKNDNKKVEKVLLDTWAKHFPGSNFLNSWMDYTDAFIRAVTYTDMFESSGRGAFTKIRVKNIYQKKFQLLTSDSFEFKKPHPNIIKKNGKTVIEEVASRDDLSWYGAVGNINLPWDDINNRRELTQELLETARKTVQNYDSNLLSVSLLDEFEIVIENTTVDLDLKDIEAELSQRLTESNIEFYERVTSKTEKNKKEILNRFEIILNNNDMSALWLEVNTWKSLVSLDGDKKVIPNFKMERDLTPRSFAPGIGNTPDMELYTTKYAIIPEVSLMTGKVQWEHEASSVIDHVMSKAIEHNSKDTIGLFLSQSINERTFWQYYILSKESWLGRPIQVVPLSIKQYTKIIRYLYINNGTIDNLYDLLKKLLDYAEQTDDYAEWKDAIEKELALFDIKNRV